MDSKLVRIGISLGVLAILILTLPLYRDSLYEDSLESIVEA